MKRLWKAGEELVVSYGPTPYPHEEVGGERNPHAVDAEVADGMPGIRAATGTSTPEPSRPKRGKKRPTSLSDFAEEPRRRRRRAANAGDGIPNVEVPRESHEVFNVESSDDE